jgi:hypothetical protein
VSTVAAGSVAGRAEADAQFRYGAVFILVLALLVFEVLSPDNDWSRSIGIALAGAALTVAVATSRAPGRVRRVRARRVGLVALIVVVGVGAGVFSAVVAFVVATILIAALPLALGGGLLRLISDRGVTMQAVAGALTIYLLIGLLFASVIAFVSHVERGTYFAQGAHVPNGVRVYYSFTVLTTTGFGDYSAAQSSGRALAVLEMLTGQLYLVTVIGLVVGNYTGRRVSRDQGNPR